MPVDSNDIDAMTAVVCPRCGAPVGNFCKDVSSASTGNGSVMASPHQERLAANADRIELLTLRAQVTAGLKVADEMDHSLTPTRLVTKLRAALGKEP